MITIRFYNNGRKNSKELRTFQFQFEEYDVLNYLYPVLSYLVQFRPKYYTIQLLKSYKVDGVMSAFTFNNGGYRRYTKVCDIESFINTLIAYAFEDTSNATIELGQAHYNTIVRQLINKFYHNV